MTATNNAIGLLGLLLIIATIITPVLAQDSAAVCETQSQLILSRPDVAAAVEAIFEAVDALACEQGNQDGTKIICGTDYENDAPGLFDNYQAVCEAAGGDFQVAHTGVACTHKSETEVDHDWLNIPHCVSSICPLDYSQTNYTSIFLSGYRQGLEVGGYACTMTSGGAKAWLAAASLVMGAAVAWILV